MAALTAAQIAYIRAKAGDGCETIGDETLQLYYDANDSSLDCTIASVLEDMWAAASPGASQLTDFGTSTDTAEIDHIKNRLDYYHTKCGSGGGMLLTGTLLLGIDATEDDLEGV